MEGLNWVMYANMVVWIVLGGYLFLLGRKASNLETRLRRSEYAARRHGPAPVDNNAGTDGTDKDAS